MYYATLYRYFSYMFLKICEFFNLIGKKAQKLYFRAKKKMRWIQSNIPFIFLCVPGID